MSNYSKYLFATCGFIACLLSAIAAAIRFGRPEGGGPESAVLAISFILAWKCLQASYAFAPRFCQMCRRDLEPGLDLDEKGRPKVRAVAIMHGRQRVIGAACLYCASGQSKNREDEP